MPEIGASWTAILTYRNQKWSVTEQSLRSDRSGYGRLLSDLIASDAGPWEQALGRLATWPDRGRIARRSTDWDEMPLYSDGIVRFTVERVGLATPAKLIARGSFDPEAFDPGAVRAHIASWERTLVQAQREYPEVQAILTLVASRDVSVVTIISTYYHARDRCRREAGARVAEHARRMGES